MQQLDASHDARQATERVVSASLAGQGGWVVTPNLDFLHKVSKNDELRQLLQDADLTVADGTPVLWAAKVLGTPLPERVAGSDLFWSVAERAASAGIRLVLIGGDDEVSAANAAKALQERFSTVSVSFVSPPRGFEGDLEATARIRNLLSGDRAIVFCGLGFPRQERLIDTLRHDFPQHWFLGVGASINMAAGKVSRAPLWMQTHGLEWLYRLYAEPRRLFRRYILEDAPFLLRLLIRCRMTRRRQSVSPNDA